MKIPSCILLTVAFMAPACAARHQAPTERVVPHLPDLWKQTCDRTEPGRLTTHGGQLVFVTGEAEPEGQPWRIVKRADGRAAWVPSAVMLHRYPGVYSDVLPLGKSGQAIAVRTEYLDREPWGRDQLVVIGADLSVRSTWSPGRRLLFLGLVGRQAVTISYDGVARISAVNLDTLAVIESEPLDLPASRFALRSDFLYSGHRTFPTDAGLPLAAPRGNHGFLLPCSERNMCEVTIGERAVRVESAPLHAGVPSPMVLEFQQRGDALVVEVIEARKPSEWLRLGCLTPTSEPLSVWAGRAPSTCPPWPSPAPELDPFAGLPVDGVRTIGARMQAQACQVAADVFLPEVRPGARDDCHVEPIDVSAEGMSGPGWSREVSVGGGCTFSMGYRDLGFALHPGSIEVLGTDEKGRYRLLLPAVDRVFHRTDCDMGMLSWRSVGNGSEPLVRQLEWEYGYCE